MGTFGVKRASDEKFVLVLYDVLLVTVGFRDNVCHLCRFIL